MPGFSALIKFPPPLSVCPAPGQRKEKDATVAELSDDEELREQLDMHSIIVSCLAEEPLFTADQVRSYMSRTASSAEIERAAA